MRFDVNISIAKKGATELGTRAEVKNLNSFKSVERAAQYEFERQVEILEKGEKVVQETRGWDDASGRTSSQRSKEDAQDYRYMPDPDIPPIVLTREEIESIQAEVPALPNTYREAWLSMNLDRSVIEALIATQRYAELISNIQRDTGDDTARRVAHWFASALSTSNEDQAIEVTNFSVDAYVELSSMVADNKLSSTAAKEVFLELLVTEKTPSQIAEEKNLIQVSDEGAIDAVVDEVLADPASAKSIEDIKAGQEKAIGFLVGQVMKKSQGKANPAMAQQAIRKKLGL
jgi:aspartyl-tRNA(Asn)/glutamyl-tRNA(Gln) amidotransferase subunit B